ncbi:Mg transporter [Lactifluus subvellereus]|nr:Mg transporter [Lactifluus subvellereus]
MSHGTPSSPLDSEIDIELTHLDATQDTYKPGLIRHSLRDDYDSDDDGDGGERALLGENTQTNWHDKTQSDSSKLWEQIRGLVVETLPTLLFTTIGSLFTGELFDKISHWKAMTSVNELIAIVPVILNLKGNIEMNLSARLGTASNIGDLDIPSVRNDLILGNLALLQVQAAVVSFIAACFSFLLGTIVPGVGEEPSEPLPANATDLFHHLRSPNYSHSHRRPRPTLPVVRVPQSGFNEFMVVASTAMSAACLSAILLGSFMCFLVVLCRKLGRDPDNIAPPIASCLGDLVTMSLLAAMSALLILGIGTAAPFVVTAVVILFATFCATFVTKNEHVRPLLKEGWTPLLGAMVISSASGIVLDLFVSRYDGYALLAVAFSGVPGGTGSIFVSRLSTAFHTAASAIRDNVLPDPAGIITQKSQPRHEPTPRVVFIVLLFVAMPVGLVYFLILHLFAWLAARFAFSMLALVFLCIAITISLAVGYYLTNYLWARGLDPDIYALPIHSAIMDLMGQLLLLLCFEIASAVGFHVRSLPKG